MWLRKGVQHIGWKRSIFHSLMYLLHLFCSFLNYTCAHNRLSQTTLILLTQSITIIINENTPIFLLSFKNVHGNQPPPLLNQLSMFAWKHMAYFYHGNLVKEKKRTRDKKIFVHGDLPSGVYVVNLPMIEIISLCFINAIYF